MFVFLNFLSVRSIFPRIPLFLRGFLLPARAGAGIERLMHVPPPSRTSVPAAGIAHRVAQAIDRVGSRAAVAKAMGVSPSTLHEYVHGGEIKLSTLIKLAEVCGVSLAWLVSGDQRDAPADLPIASAKSRAGKGFFATEVQAPAPRPTHIDPNLLLQAMQVIDAIIQTSGKPMPPLARARRIAIAYDQLVLPEGELDPLPPYAPRTVG